MLRRPAYSEATNRTGESFLWGNRINLWRTRGQYNASSTQLNIAENVMVLGSTFKVLTSEGTFGIQPDKHSRLSMLCMKEQLPNVASLHQNML